jgi:signal transduction histidine kinase
MDNLPDRLCCGSQPCPAAAHGEGLLHDARNLVGAIGLYCDLLSIPGVLKPEHRQYPDELRLLGARSRALIETLMNSLLARERPREVCADGQAQAAESIQQGLVAPDSQSGVGKTARPVSLRNIVERSSGLLSQVANGRALAIDYGPAAATPVRVAEEAVERILVNLVRNAAAALGAGAPECSSGTIRITVGMLANRVGEPKPWPFQRVRLSVEDSGCGMEPEQVEWLLQGQEPSGDCHGIGFRVVRELAAASGADLQVLSDVGAGTRVQIEWPMAAMSPAEVLQMEMSECAERGSYLKNPPDERRSRRLGDIRLQPEMEGAC